MVFAQLTAMKKIILNKNQLTAIRADNVPTKNIIEYFSATGNQLSKVESSLVWKLKDATLIDFTGNGCNYKFEAPDKFINFYSTILTKC